MKVFLAQINPTVADLKGNAEKIIEFIEQAREQKADIVLFPELCLTGYPPEDLLLFDDFLKATEVQLQSIATQTKDTVAIVGLPTRNTHHREKSLYNSAAVIRDQKVQCFYHKMLLPTYDVFDERRYFEPGTEPCIIELKGKKVAITICEDIWGHSQLVAQTAYREDPILALMQKKPDLILNLSASPFHLDKLKTRTEVCFKAANAIGCPVVLCNQVGGNDSLIFDGQSLAVLPGRKLVAQASGFAEEGQPIDFACPTEQVPCSIEPMQELYQALVLGIRDYFHKLGFKKACIGLSGGIDSALVCCLAVEALGNENVLGIAMPSRYSSDHSLKDAQALAKQLNIRLDVLSIEEPFQAYLDVLKGPFQGFDADVTEENLQARIRGMLLMAYSNKFGYIVISTGNKSEMAMGYSTLYGDLCGGLAAISDVTKTQVYSLARWINREKIIIPQSSLDKPPSAELRSNQTDQDTLPPYDMIDHVLKAYVEEHLSAQAIAKKYHYSLETVQSLIKRIHMNEYKRRQSPPGLRVSKKAFSVGRRFPIVEKWLFQFSKD